MNYKPVVAGNQSNSNAGTKECDDAGKARMEKISGKYYILLPLRLADPLLSQSPKSSPDDGFKPSEDNEKKVTEEPGKEGGDSSNDQEKDDDNVNSTNNVNTASDGNITNNINVVSSTVNVVGIEVNVVGAKTSIELPDDPNMPELKDIVYSDDDENTLVDLPNGKRVIGTKWVIRNKKDKRGIVIKNKARLVAQGICGVPDGCQECFLYGKIEEEVYVCQPPGFEDPDFPNRVYKVENALYGLHQAPRAWYETLSTYLLDNGFQRGKIDKTLFIRRDKGDILLVQVYVDDIIFGSTKKSLYIEFEKMMHKKFQISSMDRSTPMETKNPLLKDEDGEEVDVHLYRSMIGSLMYLNSSRLDIILISWQRKKQTMVANSTIEAEYVAASS
ncbi:putative ribonuclease H-like domain-containing protein [Tanacetum coccineum]